MLRTGVNSPPIAVIGMACRFPGADNVEQYWGHLVEAIESISRASNYRAPEKTGGQQDRFVPAVGMVRDIEWFDADYFRVPPAEAIVMDPQQRLLLEIAEEAMEDAGYAGDRDAVVGIFAGCGENLYLRDFVWPSRLGAGQVDDARILLANEKDFLAPRIAFKLGLTGPSVTVQTTCATALSAIALACTALAAGECDIALAGGVSLLMPDTEGYTFAPGGLFSADGACRTFDAKATGSIPGSGVGLVVLKRENEAIVDRDHRRAVIRGWAINNDGGSRSGFTVPSVAGQESVIRAALERAGLTPANIGYVEAHGTGTLIGDPIEFEALRRVFGTDGRSERTCILGAVKPNIGHTDAASGVAGFIKAALAVERGIVPATLHFTTPNPEIEFSTTPFFVSSETLEWKTDGLRIAGVSAFGLGGTNAHIILEEASPVASIAPIRARHVLALSARNQDELMQIRERLSAWLETRNHIGPAELADVAFSLAVGRPRFACRWAAIVADSAEAISVLGVSRELDRSTEKWSLHFSGTPEELATMGTRQMVAEPLLRMAVGDLVSSVDLGRIPPAQTAAITGLAAIHTLQKLGLSFTCIDGPDWFSPVLTWLENGGNHADLSAALEACSANGESSGSYVFADLGASDERNGRQLVIDSSFDLTEVVAYLWNCGVPIAWREYYGDEQRCRVALPTYPFTRRRFWIDRQAHEPAPEISEAVSLAPNLLDSAVVISTIEAIWGEVLGVSAIAHSAHFIDDLGGDSMYALEIGARINEVFKLDLPFDLPFLAPTITETAEYIENIYLDKLTF